MIDSTVCIFEFIKNLIKFFQDTLQVSHGALTYLILVFDMIYHLMTIIYDLS